MKYHAGPCPVCGTLNRVEIVRAVNEGQVFFHCPECDCAWDHAPGANADTIDPPEKFAPDGWRDAQLEEIKEAGLESFIVPEKP